MQVAAVVLAAGGSRRMGRPKQLLEIHGISLVRRAVETALATRAQTVFVVVGAEADAVSEQLAGLDVEVVDNPAWAAGLSTSIEVGTSAAEAAGADAVLITLADQPFVTADHLDALISAAAGGDAARVATGYAGGSGVPALFRRECFDALRGLEGDSGARRLLGADDARVISFEPAASDVDTPADWERALRGDSLE